MERPLIVNRDLISSRNDWKLAYGLCAANNDALVNWVLGACEIEECHYGQLPKDPEPAHQDKKCGIWARLNNSCGG